MMNNHIKHYVPQALTKVPHLIIAENEKGKPEGFKADCERAKSQDRRIL